MDSVILRKGKGKDKAEWELSQEEFEEFEWRFEESELLTPIDADDVLTMTTEDGVRQWELTESELAEFISRFEECELCDTAF